MARWLVKEEPDHYGYPQLERDGKTSWSGVRNPLAQKHLRSIRTGDHLFYYHTGKEKAIVATARAASDAYLDPADRSRTLHAVDVAPERALPRPVTLAEIKADPGLASFPLVRMPRLSVMPVTEAQWRRIEELSRSGLPRRSAGRTGGAKAGRSGLPRRSAGRTGGAKAGRSGLPRRSAGRTGGAKAG